jgi:hypothetical protein
MKRIGSFLCLCALGAGIHSERLWAEVAAVDRDGFVSVNSIEVRIDPDRAFEGIVEPARWWDPAHTYSGDAANLSLAPTAGGCFCERLPGGGVEHARVVFVRPGRSLRLLGGLGPLQEHAVIGVLGFGLEPTDGGTRITLTYRVSGHLEGGLAAWAEPVDRVLAGQMRRLQSFLDAVGSE